MKYRQRKELVKGDSPYLEVKVVRDGTEARVKVQYARTSVAKDVKTTTFGVLDLGFLTPDDLACVGRSVARALNEMQDAYVTHLDEAMNSVRRVLA